MGNRPSGMYFQSVTGDMHPLKVTISVNYHNEKTLKWDVPFTAFLETNNMSTPIKPYEIVLDVNSTYTHSIKLHVAKYIKQANWLIVMHDQHHLFIPAPVDGRVPYSKFPGNARITETHLDMSTYKKGAIRHPFSPRNFGETMRVGQKVTMWVYTYDEQGIVHHYHAFIAEAQNIPFSDMHKIMNINNKKRSSSSLEDNGSIKRQGLQKVLNGLLSDTHSLSEMGRCDSMQSRSSSGSEKLVAKPVQFLAKTASAKHILDEPITETVPISTQKVLNGLLSDTHSLSEMGRCDSMQSRSSSGSEKLVAKPVQFLAKTASAKHILDEPITETVPISTVSITDTFLVDYNLTVVVKVQWVIIAILLTVVIIQKRRLAEIYGN